MRKLTFSNRTSHLIAVIVLISISILFAGCSQEAMVNSQGDSFKVMTYNIHHGQGTDDKLDLGRIAKVIARSGCDVVGLQEVDNNYGSRSLFYNQIKWLAEKLEMHYAFGPAIVTHTVGTPQLYGNAILSTYPIIESENYQLYAPPGHEPRACLKAIVKINETDYTFMVTHLDHQRTIVRVRQAADISKNIPRSPTRTILMGDFNCTTENIEVSEPIDIILEKLKDSFVVTGAPEQDSFKGAGRIDYIFVSPDLSGSLENYTVIKDKTTTLASDHRPVTVEFKSKL